MVDKQEKELETEEWWNQPDSEPKEKPTEEELIQKIEVMKKAGKAIPSRYILKQTLAIAAILVNGFLLYMGIGKPYQTYIFTYSAAIILILIDYMRTVKSLRNIAQGEN